MNTENKILFLLKMDIPTCHSTVIVKGVANMEILEIFYVILYSFDHIRIPNKLSCIGEP